MRDVLSPLPVFRQTLRWVAGFGLLVVLFALPLAAYL
jgi:hypothetical protein